MTVSVGELLAELGLDTSKFDRGLAGAGEKFKGLGRSLEEFGGKLSSLGSRLSVAVTAPILGIGAAATKAGMDAVESEDLFERAFGGMAGQARKWSEQVSDAVGTNSYALRENASFLFMMTKNMGVAGDEAFKMSTSLTELAGDMASAFNLETADAIAKITAGISGEAEPLKRLGILVTENTIKQVAYSAGIAEYGKELTETQKVQARYLAIMQQTATVQGNLAETIESPANQLRVFKEEVAELSAEFGMELLPVLQQDVLPVMKQLTATAKDLLTQFRELTPETKKFAISGAALAAAVGPAAVIFGQLSLAIGNLIALLKSAATPWILMAAAIGSVVKIGADLWSSIQEGTQLLRDFSAAAKEGNLSVADVVQGLVDWLDKFPIFGEQLAWLTERIFLLAEAWGLLSVTKPPELPLREYAEAADLAAKGTEDVLAAALSPGGFEAVDQKLRHWTERMEKVPPAIRSIDEALKAQSRALGDWTRNLGEAADNEFELNYAMDKASAMLGKYGPQMWEILEPSKLLTGATKEWAGVLLNFTPQMRATGEETEKTADAMDELSSSLNRARAFGELFGRGFANIFGGLSTAVSGVKALTQSVSGGLSGIFSGGILSSLSNVGNILGAAGAIVGPAFEILSKLFKPKWKKLAEEGARVFGQELSEGLSRELVKVADRLGSVQNAFAARIGDIVSEIGVSGENVGEIYKHVGYLLGMVENGTLSWAEAVEQVDKAFGPLVEQLEKMGTVGSYQIGQLITRMRELGEVSAEVQSFIDEKAKDAISSLSTYFDYLLQQETLTGEQAQAALTYMAGAFEAALMSAGSLVGAIGMLGDSFGQLLERLREVLGDENAVLNAMTQYYNFVKNNEDQLNALAALGEGFKSLLELGIVNRENIDQFAAGFKQQFDEMLAKTNDQTTALIAMGPQIGQLMEAYQAMGLQVPQWLADMAEQAKEAGASLEPPEGLPDILADIRDILAAIAKNAGIAASEWGGLNREMSNTPSAPGSHVPRPGRGGRGDEGFQKETPPAGLFFGRPTRILVGEVPEVVTVRHASRTTREPLSPSVTENHYHFDFSNATVLDKDGLIDMVAQGIEGNRAGSAHRVKEGVRRVGG